MTELGGTNPHHPKTPPFSFYKLLLLDSFNSVNFAKKIPHLHFHTNDPPSTVATVPLSLPSFEIKTRLTPF
jgi:hypothetical protein